MLRSVGYRNLNQEQYLLFAKEFYNSPTQVLEAFNTALAFMCRRLRPWSLILVQSGDSTIDQSVLSTIERQLNELLYEESKQFFLGFSIVYHNGQEEESKEPTIYERKHYENMHSFMLAWDSLSLQIEVNNKLP